jgi:DNA replication protein
MLPLPHNESPTVSPTFLLRLVRDVWNPVELKMIVAVAALNGGQMPVAENTLVDEVDVLAGIRADGSSRSAADRAREGLGAAVARGMLIALSGDEGDRWYVLASDENRRKASQGKFVIPNLAEPTPLPIERPGIYALYEQNIGLLSPIIADRIADALLRYPEIWIEDAIGEAVSYNRRSWRYIERILENWATEGRSDETHRRDHETDGASRKTLRDKYDEFFRKR